MGNFQKFHLGVKAVVIDSQGKILLVRLNPKFMQVAKSDNYWDFPGGRVTEGESVEECLKRRLLDEVGMEVKILDGLGLTISNVIVNDTNNQTAKLILQVFLCQPLGKLNIKLSAEFAEFGWFSSTESSQLLREKYPGDFADRFISANKIESHSGNIVQVVIEKVTMKKDDQEITRVFEQARRSPGTRLIVVSDDKVLLTKEFRREVNSYDYRLPGGKVFDTLDEYLKFLKSDQDLLPKVIEAGKKEAKEEIGINAYKIELFHKSIAGATIEWDLYYLVINEFTSLSGQSLELGEDIGLMWVSFPEAKEICLSGEMSEDRSAAVLLRYLYQAEVL